MDLFDFPSTDQGQWYDLVNKLDGQFTGAGITPLTFGCSVTGKLGTVHDCVWTFAAARAAVDPTTAAITVDAPTFQCHVKPNTTSAKLIAWLANTTDLLHTALPGTSTTIEASLDDCFCAPGRRHGARQQRRAHVRRGRRLLHDRGESSEVGDRADGDGICVRFHLWRHVLWQ